MDNFSIFSAPFQAYLCWIMDCWHKVNPDTAVPWIILMVPNNFHY